MKRLLITGASGLLGFNLALEAARDYAVFGVVNRRRVQTETFSVLEADLLLPGAVPQVFDLAAPDWLVHCAALTDLEACESDPGLAQRMNAELPGLLAAEAARRGIRMLHISTDAVFDGLRGGRTEEHEPNPRSVYARTKLEGERAVAEANPDAIIARVNFYGWSLDGNRSLAEFFFNRLHADSPVNGFTDVVFCPLLVNHLSRILLAMLSADLRGLYHVVSSESLSKYDFGVAIARRFSLDEGLVVPASVDDSGLVAPRSPDLTLSTAKLARDLGEAPPGVQAGIDHFYALYQRGYPQEIRDMLVRVMDQ